MSAERLVGPEPLGSEHEVDAFDCGVDSRSEYLRSQALSDQQSEKSRTFVVCRGRRVVAYFGLAAASVEPEDTTDRVARGQGRHAVPAVLITRLAVDVAWQGRGVGEAMLVQAIAKSVQAANTIGARVVLVHCLDDRARGFYLKYGFAPSRTNELHVMMLMKDARKTLRALD